MNLSFTYAPHLPVAMIVILGIISLLLVAISFYVRQRGTFLRLASLAALVLALLNPAINSQVRKPLSDIGVVVIDQSPSQQIGNRTAQTQKARRQIMASLPGLPNLQLRTVIVSPQSTPNSEGTNAFTALKAALADIPADRYAGAVFITDGQIHDVPKELEDITASAPVHALLTGTKTEKDRRIVIEAAPKFAIVGKQQALRFKVEQWGTSPFGQSARVFVAFDGKPAHEITVFTGKTYELSIQIPHGGQNIVELSIKSFKGELSKRNNRAIAIIRGIRDRLRVLLVSGKPHPGERTWRNLLKADPSVDLVHFTILRPPNKQDSTPVKELSLIAFPTRELFSKKLNDFDLIIFDRYARHGVLRSLYLFNIADYVNRGGAVLVAAGPDYAGPSSIYHSALADILPAIPDATVSIGPFRPRLTTKGARHPVVRGLKGASIDNPAWGKWFRMVNVSNAGGTTLMTGIDGKPVLLVSRVKKGRVAQLMSDQSWLWARGYDGGGPQAELLRRMAHWLMGEPELEEEALSGKQQGKNLVIKRQTMAATTGQVSITSPSGKTITTVLKKSSPGIWQTKIPVTEPGIYRLDQGDKTAFAGIGNPDPLEARQVHSTAQHMKPVADKTDGAIKRIETSIPRLAMVKPGRAHFGSGWIGLKRNNAYTVTSIKVLPLFSTLLALAALLLLIATMWYREGQ